MIIGRSSRIHDFYALVSALKQAARGVVLVRTGETDVTRFISTAWLITDSLVVMPSYVASMTQSSTQYVCFFGSSDVEESMEVNASLISQPIADEPFSRKPILLRLEKPVEGRSLSLDTRSALDLNQVFLLQYPGGRKKLKISIGQLLDADGSILKYNADTEPGSGGCPILTETGKVGGIHNASSAAKGSLNNEGYNEGMPLADVLESLSRLPEWPEIAKYQNLADISIAQTTIQTETDNTIQEKKDQDIKDAVLLDNALKWSIDPEKKTDEEKEILRPYIVDTSAPIWTLGISDRQDIIRHAGSIDALKKVHTSTTTENTGDKVIEQILNGPPYSIDTIDDEELPYWLQAVRWFTDVIPEVPSPETINHALEKRRIKNNLTILAGPDFRNRFSELDQMKKWYEDKKSGPLIIWGIGGMGKSALISKFVLALPDETFILWLDFDRADLAPDDAVSVLKQVIEQATVQLVGFSAPELKKDNWKEGAKKIGSAIHKITKKTVPPLAILDGFEIAQHADQYYEVWEVLDTIMDGLPGLRVLVSGRAPVQSFTNLSVDGHPLKYLTEKKPTTTALLGLDTENTAEWLKDHGISDEKSIARVTQISKGVPLILKLAARFVKEGGSILDLQQLPDYLVEGFLYQRILYRVIDPLLKPIARDILVVRNLCRGMINEVFFDRLPEGLTPDEIFSRLMKEMGLVTEMERQAGTNSLVLTGEADMLHLRPEVRSATLKLLETEDAARVREIDSRAVTWYEKQDLNDVKNRAELIYHYLRLGKIPEAERAWKDECSAYLKDAANDLPDSATNERKWISDRVQQAQSVPDNYSWEVKANLRIRDLIGRGLFRAVPGILQEKSNRTADSPLLIYDAWVMKENHDLNGARRLLSEAASANNTDIKKSRDFVAAMLANEQGDIEAADILLSSYDKSVDPKNTTNWDIDKLLVRASRIRLFTDLDLELKLYKTFAFIFERARPQAKLSDYMLASDVMLPPLCELASLIGKYESLNTTLFAPLDLNQLDRFRWSFAELKKYKPLRNQILEKGMSENEFIELFLNHDNKLYSDLKTKKQDGLVDPGDFGDVLKRLINAGARKWELATNDLFIGQSAGLQLRSGPIDNFASFAIIGTLGALRGQPMQIPLSDGRLASSIDEFIDIFITDPRPNARPVVKPNEKTISIAMDVMTIGADTDKYAHNFLYHISKQIQLNKTTPIPAELIQKINRKDLKTTLFYILSPNPLEILSRRTLGFPDDYVM
jgi:hypothetical protein